MARLPQPGGDQGAWGTILNDFLSQSLNSDGSLRTSALASAGAYHKASAGIPRTDLASDVQASLDNADAAASGTAPDASSTTKGIIRLTGDLTGTAAYPSIATGVISNSHISASAAISQSKVANLTSDLSSKANASDVTTALAGKANVSHTHTASQISDATVTGRAVLIATDAAAARTAIGAGTSNLTLGTTSTTAKAGDYAPTKSDVGLGNVDNTSDVNKPISTATQTALDAKASSTHTHTASQISDATTTGRAVVTATDAAAARAAIGAGSSNLTIGTTSTTAKAGDYAPTKADLGLSNVDNTSDASKPISSATQTALNAKASSTDLTAGLATKANTSHTHAIADVTNLQTTLDQKAPLASPAFTGTPTVNGSPIGGGTTIPDSVLYPQAISGFKSWAFDPAAATATNGAIASYLVVTRQVSSGGTISNLHVGVATISASVTNFMMLMYDQSGTLLGQSADDATVVQTTTGFKTMALQTPVTTTPGQIIYVGMYIKGANLTILRANSNTPSSGIMHVGIPRCLQVFASSTYPSSITPGTMSSPNLLYWFGAS